MTTDFSDYSEENIINIALRAASLTGAANVYMALMTVNPTDAGGGTEAAYPSYARVACAFSAPSSQTISNSAQLTFVAVTSAPVTVTAIAIYNASSGGDLLAWKALSPTLAYAINDVPVFDIGAITITFPTTDGTSAYIADRALNCLFRNTAVTGASPLYAALYSAAPSGAGGGTEWSHSGYARQAISFDAPSGGVTQNASALTFAAVAGSGHTLVAIGVFDALTGGNLLVFEVLGASVSFAVGNVPKIADSGFVYTVT